MSLITFSNFIRLGIKSKLKHPLSTILITHSNPYTLTDLNHITKSYSQTSKTMRFIRFQRGSDKNVHLGSLSDDAKSFLPFDVSVPTDMTELIKSNVSMADIDRIAKTKSWEPLSNDIKLLAPIQNPEKIICIGLNYLGHCKEQNKEAPKEPMFFSKYANTITGPTGDVILHEITDVCINRHLNVSHVMII